MRSLKEKILGILRKSHSKRKSVIFKIVLALLLLSIVYAIYMYQHAPSGPPQNEYDRVKSDYVLMVLQCAVGSIVIFLPSQMKRRFGIRIPDTMEILYFIFLFCAIYLGEVRNFYYKVPFWDLILHSFSGMMLGAFGFILVNFLNNMKRPYLHLSPFFVALFAFCFAVTCGTAWEIYEFLADGILGTNMQKFITADGVVLIGREALSDTMEDIIVDVVSALAITTYGYFHIRVEQRKRQHEKSALKTVE